MEKKEFSSAVKYETALKSTRSMLLDNGKARVTPLGCTLFPEAVSRIVGDYLSELGISNLGFCWNLGFLPSESQWGSWHTKVDKQFSITDVEEVLSFLNEKDSDYCRIVIEVLVLTFSVIVTNIPRVFDGLRKAINAFQGRLKTIKHVVIEITDHSYCCFTLKNTPDKETGVSLQVDQRLILLQIIDDLETCWKANSRLITEGLTTEGLFVFYFKGDAKPASEIYLAKFVVSLACPLSQALFKKEASRRVSNKIMWVSSLESEADLNFVDQDTTRLCHAINLNATKASGIPLAKLNDWFNPAFCFYDNPYIERIVTDSYCRDPLVRLPRPSGPLTSTTPLSALVELTLIGPRSNLDLTELNNGYFPHLAHLTVIGGNITGHLDSDRVSSLKTLRLEPKDFYYGNVFPNYSLVHERAQSLIHAGRPWQLVAAKTPGGWSLASYDEPTTGPQDEVKDDTFHAHSLPFIRELLLVMQDQVNADEWQLKLTGIPSVESLAGDHRDRLLVWSPQCVQKITAISVSESLVMLYFLDPIPEQTRVLDSFTCHNFTAFLNSDSLPNLQSLVVNGGNVNMSGAFHHLAALSFEKTNFQSQSQPGAPILKSFCCSWLKNGESLSLPPQLLLHLPLQQIKPMEADGFFVILARVAQSFLFSLFSVSSSDI